MRLVLRTLKRFARAIGVTPYLRKWLYGDGADTSTTSGLVTNSISYRAKLLVEQANFAQVEEVHDLPPIFHYWSNKYLRPKLEQFGFSHPDAFFVQYLERAMVPAPKKSTFISIGAGNCDSEVRIAKELVNKGHRNFVIHCLDINDDMLARGTSLATSEGVAQHVKPLKGDFNEWKPDRQYHAVMANQSLHHVVGLESLFDAIKTAIGENGIFITSDMIGRNGHQRWPEALEIVNEFWRELPESYRYNVQLKRQEDEFGNWDCSVSGFEGVRAQDIMPLLIERFNFELFIAYGNVVDPFIDRSFGPHFDADSEWSRNFIDRVHARDESEMLAGKITPTHMMGVMRVGACFTKHCIGFSPVNAVRCPDGGNLRLSKF